MTIEFECPFCQKVLSAPDERAGNPAKCPQCGESITVPAPESATAIEAYDDVIEKTQPQWPRTVVCPMCGASNTESADACFACGEELQQTRLLLGEVRTIRAKQLLSRSWSLFWQYPGVCLMGPLLAYILMACLGALLAGMLVLTYMGLESVMQGGDALLILVSALLGLIVLIVFLFVVAYFELGKTILFLNLALDQEPTLGDLFKGSPYVGRMVLCSLLFHLLVTLANLIIALLGYVVAMLFWPYPFLLVDRNLPGVEAFSRAIDVTKGNLLTLFLVFMFLTGVALAGAAVLFGGAYLLVESFVLPLEPVMGGAIMVGVAGSLVLYSYLLVVKAVAFVQITFSR